ncbi:hypothetical protein DSL72_008151 [Monilinia vaccinii-corymbosi]|uniref:Uncharacterized protein n=1 Tax=Monilinia vaccinii-corymbosi TaxID=61207 RepID=A0A8A3PJ14_9HELO|nr:hypothetical protein DSL72_008151 [Monilinia vaccinii-corymbosi]
MSSIKNTETPSLKSGSSDKEEASFEKTPVDSSQASIADATFPADTKATTPTVEPPSPSKLKRRSASISSHGSDDEVSETESSTSSKRRKTQPRDDVSASPSPRASPRMGLNSRRNGLAAKKDSEIEKHVYLDPAETTSFPTATKETLGATSAPASPSTPVETTTAESVKELQTVEPSSSTKSSSPTISTVATPSTVNGEKGDASASVLTRPSSPVTHEVGTPTYFSPTSRELLIDHFTFDRLSCLNKVIRDIAINSGNNEKSLFLGKDLIDLLRCKDILIKEAKKQILKAEKDSKVILDQLTLSHEAKSDLIDKARAETEKVKAELAVHTELEEKKQWALDSWRAKDVAWTVQDACYKQIADLKSKLADARNDADAWERVQETNSQTINDLYARQEDLLKAHSAYKAEKDEELASLKEENHQLRLDLEEYASTHEANLNTFDEMTREQDLQAENNRALVVDFNHLQNEHARCQEIQEQLQAKLDQGQRWANMLANNCPFDLDRVDAADSLRNIAEEQSRILQDENNYRRTRSTFHNPRDVASPRIEREPVLDANRAFWGMPGNTHMGDLYGASPPRGPAVPPVTLDANTTVPFPPLGNGMAMSLLINMQQQGLEEAAAILSENDYYNPHNGNYFDGDDDDEEDAGQLPIKNEEDTEELPDYDHYEALDDGYDRPALPTVKTEANDEDFASQEDCLHAHVWGGHCEDCGERVHTGDISDYESPVPEEPRVPGPSDGYLDPCPDILSDDDDECMTPGGSCSHRRVFADGTCGGCGNRVSRRQVDNGLREEAPRQASPEEAPRQVPSPLRAGSRRARQASPVGNTSTIIDDEQSSEPKKDCYSSMFGGKCGGIGCTCNLTRNPAPEAPVTDGTVPGVPATENRCKHTIHLMGICGTCGEDVDDVLPGVIPRAPSISPPPSLSPLSKKRDRFVDDSDSDSDSFDGSFRPSKKVKSVATPSEGSQSPVAAAPPADHNDSDVPNDEVQSPIRESKS